jgi:predicted nucleotidyltransferase component of viral defense system
MERRVKNVAESVRARLYGLAREEERDFDSVLLQYFQERILFRISRSSYRDCLVLKGALLLVVRSVSRFRPTRDMDFLARGFELTPESIIRMIGEITDIDCPDGVTFIKESVAAEILKEGAEYEGVRAKIITVLGSIRKWISLDFGCGDVLVRDPETIVFPVLLDQDAPQIRCYPLETVIAEKLQAIVWLGFANSRMKDFFDIRFLLLDSELDRAMLRQAIEATFAQRATALERRHEVFSDAFKNDKHKQEQWLAFLRKNGLEAPGEFSSIVSNIEKLIEPLFE